MAKHKSNWDASYEFGARGFSKPLKDTATFIPAQQTDVDPKELLDAWRKARTVNLDDTASREAKLASLTSPNIIGFFPKYDPTSAHSAFRLSQFDTETADDNRQIVEIAGVQVIWNKSKQQFEQPPDAMLNNQFFRVYNPPNARYLATEAVHGYNSSILDKIRKKLGLDKSLPLSWNSSQLAEFKQWAKGTIFTGHNIYNADLAWIHNRKSGEFVFEEPSFKQGFLDTFHLAEAVYGKSPKGEGRNKLQNLATRLGVSAASLGLPAHEAWADSIVNLKVLEKIIQQNPNNPAVQEFINAMDYGNMQSHRKENPDPLHGSYLVTHTISGKPAGQGSIAQALKKKFKIKIKEKYINDIPSSLGMTEEEFIESNWDRSSYEEMSMADTDDDLKETLAYLGKRMGGGMSDAQHQQLLKAVAELSGWSKISFRERMLTQITNKGLSESEKQYALRGVGLVPSEINTILHRSSDLETAKIQRDRDAEYRNLRLRSGRFLAEQAAAGYAKSEWFETLRDAHRQGVLTEDVLATAKQSRKNQDAREAAWETDKLAKAKEASSRNDLEIRAMAGSLNNQPEVDYRAARKMLADKKASLDNTEYLTGAQKKQFADRTHDMVESLEEYQKAVKDTVTHNKRITSTIKAMASAGRGLYNPQGYWQAEVAGASEIGQAINGLLPSIFRPAGQRATTAMTQFMEAGIAPKQNLWNQLSNAGNIVMAGGGALTMLNPIAGGIVSGLGGALNLASNLIGGKAQADITEATKLMAGRINLLSASFSALLAPLKLLRGGLNGFLGLYSKLASIMGIRYGMPYTSLTSISSAHYSAMLDADSVFGLKAGTINAMHNNMAFGQAGLYTSGQFDTNRLIAAARLGVFSSVYAPMGGNTEEQMADTIDRLSARMAGADKRTQQEIMYFAKSIDPAMPEILNRMAKLREAGIYTGGFKGFQNGSAFKNVQQWHMSAKENAKWEWTSAEFSSTRHQTDMALKRIATPLWEKLGQPIANAFNELLNTLPSFISDKGVDWSKVKEAGAKFWSRVTETLGISGKSPDDLLKSALDKAKNFLGSELGETLLKGLWTAIGYINKYENLLLDALAPMIQRAKDYLSDIDFNINIGKDGRLISFDIDTPEEKKARNRAFVESETTKWDSYKLNPGQADIRHYENLRDVRKNLAWLKDNGYELAEAIDITDKTQLATKADDIAYAYTMLSRLPHASANQRKSMLQYLKNASSFKLSEELDATTKSLVQAGHDTLSLAPNMLKDMGVSFHQIELKDTTGRMIPAMEEQIGKGELLKMGISVNGDTMRFTTAVTRE